MAAPPSGGAAGAPAEPSTNGVVFWPVAVAVFLADLITKALAAAALWPRGLPHPVLGDGVRLTLVYNPGAAFGLHLGPHSRWLFLALTAAVLRVLWRLYRRTRDRDNVRTVALALLCAGAVGNAVDRVRSSEGVIDFIDLGIGALRWPTFNLADVAVTGGAALLAWVLWGADDADGVASALQRAPAPGSPAHTPAPPRMGGSADPA